MGRHSAPQPQTTKGERQSCGMTGNLITEVLQHAQGLAHDSPRTPNVHISRPRRLKHHQKRTPKREKEERNVAGEGKKRAKFGAPPFGAPPFGLRGPTFSRFGLGLHPSTPFSRFGPLPCLPPFGGPTLCGPKNRSWPTLAKTDFGQNRLWPKRVWPKPTLAKTSLICCCVVCCVCVCACVQGLSARPHPPPDLPASAIDFGQFRLRPIRFRPVGQRRIVRSRIGRNRASSHNYGCHVMTPIKKLPEIDKQ